MALLKIRFRRDVFEIVISLDRSVSDLFTYLRDVIDLEGLRCRLIIGGRSFQFHESDPGIENEWILLKELSSTSATAILLASSDEDLERMKKFKPDPLLKGLDAEQIEHEKRVSLTYDLSHNNPWGIAAAQDPDFRFERFQVLYKRLEPPPFSAEKLLTKLATDPAIVQIMRARRFKVATLCELDPLDADIEQFKKGEGDKCLLGWNKNYGERIALRLRTNDLQGFRRYDDIVTTLIHELSHNVVGPHNNAFWTLFNQLKEDYRSFHIRRDDAPKLSDPRVQAVSKLSNFPDCESVSSGNSSYRRATVHEMRAARLAALDKK
jgi:hypothetical protein